MKRIALFLLPLLAAWPAGADTDDVRHAQDFFFYHCVHEFYKGESLDKTDASVGLAAEIMSLDYDRSMALAKRVKKIVRGLRADQKRPASEVSEGTAGKAMVLMTCLDESRKYRP